MLLCSTTLKLEGGDFFFKIEKKQFENSKRKYEGHNLYFQALIYETYTLHTRSLQSR